jgi:hypothetical protein
MRWIAQGFSLVVGFILAMLNFELLALDGPIRQLEKYILLITRCARKYKHFEREFVVQRNLQAYRRFWKTGCS